MNPSKFLVVALAARALAISVPDNAQPGKRIALPLRRPDQRRCRF